MTNREALEVIERLGVDSRGYPNLKEALEMAIKALSVDLVRCGECKYRDCCFELNDKIEADDYCSCGERRSND